VEDGERVGRPRFHRTSETLRKCGIRWIQTDIRVMAVQPNLDKERVRGILR